MERLGAFDRSHLVLFSPTGTGWVDHAVVSAAELFTSGDIATACVQYGRSPSFLAVQTVALGRSQFRLLLWSVKQRLAERPPERRPKVFVFGESLGAWSSSDVVMRQGIDGFDHYGIDKALWFGLPGLAKWSRTGMREGRGPNVPEGSVGAFDNPDDLAGLSDAQRDAMRAVILDHDNDPIALMSPRLAVKRPPWLRSETRGRNVPEEMDWIPVLTLVQVIVDAMNAMRTVPGEFKSFGHDYRGDTAAMVHGAWGLPKVTPGAVRRGAARARSPRRWRAARGSRLRRRPGWATPPPRSSNTGPTCDRSGAGQPLPTAQVAGTRQDSLRHDSGPARSPGDFAERSEAEDAQARSSPRSVWTPTGRSRGRSRHPTTTG